MIRWMRYLLAMALCVLSVNAFAQAWPSRPITWIVPYPAGGVTDATSRAVAKRVSEILGTPVSVENKAGAAGMIGTEQGVRAAPDGYTVMYISPGPVVTNPHLYKTMRYDPLKDLTFVHGMFASPAVLVVPASSPFKTLAELVDYAKRNPDKLNFGSSGSGTAPHIGMEIFRLNAGIQMTHVPYKGSAPAIAELLGGQTQVMIDAGSALLPMIRAGKLRALAVTGARRDPQLPDVPSVRELGLGAMESVGFQGLVGPAGIPKDVVAVLSTALARALDTPDVRAKFAGVGAEVSPLGADAFGAFVRAENEKWATLIRTRKLQLD